jgi:HD-GYP domain-containing protein (c-di-GMP phosphodiesterase class II)
MIRKFFSGMSLLARFTLVSFFITLLIATGLAWRLELALERDALSAVAQNTADQATHILNKNLTAADLETALSGKRYEEIDTLIHNTLLSADIVRVKIWNRDGLLVYSDDKNIMGKAFPIEVDLQEAFNGEIATDISKLQAEENIGERGLYRELFEIYVPLHPTDSDAILGAYEVYYDLSKLQPRLLRIRYTVWSGVGITFLILYGTLFLLIRNASRELVQRNKENRALLVTERRERELSERLERLSRALSEILDLRKLLDLICRESVDVFNTHSAFLWLLEGGELVGFSAYGPRADQFIGMRAPIYDPQLLGARVARERKPILVNDAPNSTEVDQKMIKRFDIKSMMGIPLVKGAHVLGSLMIMDSENPQRFNKQDLEMASIFGGHAALAIDNAQLYEKAQLHLKHEKALREIDLAISSKLELNSTLQVVLYQARARLHVDACAILLLDPDTQTLEYTSGQGFRTEIIKETHLHLGEGSAGYAAQELRIFGRAEIESPAEIPDRAELITAENFVAYFIAPLIVKDKLLGGLEIYHRAPLIMKTEWLKFLETLAGQTAIAIDNATLFADLQRSNSDLTQAYDTTLEGWSTALDLRDRETEGHTKRVTEMTVRLAERMGVSPQELIQIRRGALLHDIGKMGVPDRILLKPDKLTDEEWVIMRMHPTYAFQMLKPIAYLQLALDIPYCHHEKWDGSGYPRGLKGDEIPLGARIFCIVDVYDALTSNRPYRAAWPKDRALDHIRGLSGTHFEPRVVEAFLKLVGEEQTNQAIVTFAQHS